MRIAIVDDHPLFRRGLAASIEDEGDFKIVGYGGTADEAIALAVEHLPDIMLLDVTLPGGGIEAVRAISLQVPIVRVVMVTASESREHVMAALDAGARGYVLKGIGANDLVRTLKSIHSGETYITPQLAAHLLRQARQRQVQAPDRGHVVSLSDLTARELEVLNDVAQGLTNKEIARRRSIAEKTVKHYMTSIMEKLQVRNRVEAALICRASNADDAARRSSGAA